MTDYRPVRGAASAGPARTHRVLAVAAVSVLAAGLLGGGVLLGRAGSPTSVAAAGRGGADGGGPSAAAAAGGGGGMPVAVLPHGPAVIEAGVPSGYTGDRAGAAAAAVNVLQACWAAAAGAVDPGRVRATMFAARPSVFLLGMVAADRPADPASGQELVPGSVTVLSQDPGHAVVSVWAVSTFGSAPVPGDAGPAGSTRAVTSGGPSGVVGGVRGSAAWVTFTVALVWERQDWKALDVSVVDGPDPAGPAGSGVVPLPGLLTVFVG